MRKVGASPTPRGLLASECVWMRWPGSGLGRRPEPSQPRSGCRSGSVERWRRQWREGGALGVASKGSSGRSRLSDGQISRLERELERGPLAHGWADQRWTLARVKTLIGRMFHVSYTVEDTWRLLKRHGWSWQQPTRRAIERDDDAVELWKTEVWPRVRASRRPATDGSSSRTRPVSR
ncbi:winged helix-turn-helix domain-containing protein [Streptomyces sp. NPDC059909]|uniref:winged helix-turn-helix domain-containing protein n=1 Tax=Streptomyces sp. NPDC059909 TaxID=3346998 RepID=UPI003647289D